MPSKKATCKLCDRKAHKRGYCRTHYRRALAGKRLDDPIRERRRADVDEFIATPNVPEPRYTDEWKRFCDWLGIVRDRRAKVPAAPTGDTVTHGIISDLHIPFHDMESLEEGVAWIKRQGATIISLGGDVADHYSLSRFSQYESIPIQREAIETRKILDWLAREFAEVRIMQGNHESRERKYLASRLPPDLVNWFHAGGFMARITQDMPNVKLVERTVCDEPMYWIAPLGRDAVIAHAETVSKIPMRAADNVKLWLDNWHEVLDISRPRVILQAHTHQAGIAWVGPRMIVELGSCCKVQGYTLTPRLYGKPQRQAVTVLTQTNGVTQPNSVRQYYPRA